jgi:hypothetical protein
MAVWRQAGRGDPISASTAAAAGERWPVLTWVYRSSVRAAEAVSELLGSHLGV